MTPARGLLPALLTMTAGLAGCGQVGEDTSRFFLVSRTTAETLGKQNYDAEVEQARQAERLDIDPDQARLVAEVTARLVEEAKRRYPVGRDWAWEIHVLDDPAVNAYCSPGGKMMVLSGLLKATDMDPDRIATVIGHEISHALLEHARASLSRDWLLHSGMWIVAKSLKMGEARSQSAIEGLNTALLPMNRNHEREADALGLEIMAHAGFNPEQGILFWRDAEAEGEAVRRGEKNLEAFISTHPTDEERLARLTELARAWRTKTETGEVTPR